MASDKPESNNNNQAEASDGAADVNAAVEELLNSISSKFASVSSEIFAKSAPDCWTPRP
jgi:heat shock factor-binding protein 1